MQNKSIETELGAWLAFLSFDAPERIEELITGFPEFTALHMIDEMQAQIDRKKVEIRAVSQYPCRR